MSRSLACTVALALLSSMVPAQADEVLALRRGEDRQARDRLYQKLHSFRVDVHLEDASVKDLAEFLATASGNVTNFAAWTKGDIEPITLRLKRTRLTTVMDIAQRFGGVRFVFSNGVVLIQLPDEVKEYTSLRTYSVAAATMHIPSFPGPDLRLSNGEEDLALDDDTDTENTASGFTADKLVDLIRTHVLPESWDENGVSITQFRGVLHVRQTEKGHRKVVELLRALGVIPTPRRVVRPESAPRPTTEKIEKPEAKSEPRRR